MITELREGLSGGGREGRCCILSAILLSLSVYVSSTPEIVVLVIVASTIITSGRSLKVLKAFLPFYMFFAISAVFFGFQVLQNLAAFMAIISAGSIIYSSDLGEISGALLYFRLPQKFVSIVSLAISILPLILSDFENIKEIHTSKGISGYYKLLRIFTSTTILRAINISESLYSKGFDFRAFGELRKPDLKDIAMLTFSVSVIIYSALQAISLDVSTWIPSSM